MTPQPEALPRRTLLKGAVALGGGLLLAACGDSSPPSEGKTITFKDQRGKTLTFKSPVRRIVTIPFPAAAIVVAVDKTSKHLVGMNEASWTAVRDGILGSIFPAALDVAHDVANVEFAPNVESILKLKPDVVIQWGNRGEEIIAPLEAASANVLGVNYGKLDDVKTWITMFAAMLGKPERAVAMNKRIDVDKAAVEARTKSVTGPSPKILYFLRFAESLQVTGTGTFNDEYIKLIGGTNAADIADQPEVDVEQILKWDPEIILLGNFDTAMPSDIYGDKKWATLSAVKNRRVYRVPLGGYRWDPPSHESPLMWNWLSAIAFPGASAPDIRAKIVEDYDFFYGDSPKQAEIDKILWLDANADSANYEQFSAT